MPNPKKIFDKTIRLTDRRIISVTGEDAKSFLQNIMTNDIEIADQSGIVYSCLLTPQGQFLNDFFVVKKNDGYLIDIEDTQADDFLRRIMMFKLRAKVDANILGDHFVYTGEGVQDPRSKYLGTRHYTTDDVEQDGSLSDYDHFCIGLGIPNGLKTIRAEKDILADVNLDQLSAVGWDKGCFIGQEVTARMKYRGLAKKRLMVIKGDKLSTGAFLSDAGKEIGDIRQIDKNQQTGLIIVKLRTLETLHKEGDLYAQGQKILGFPDYLNVSS